MSTATERPAGSSGGNGLAPGLYWRQLRRETRGSRGRLLYFIACLTIGVAAVTAVAALAAAVDRTVRGEARQLLAADLSISGRRPASPELLALIDAMPGVARSGLRETVTVVASPSGRSQLVELKVVEGGYPFYGEVRLDPPLGPGSLADVLGDDGVIVGPEMVSRLGIPVGGTLRVGGADFEVRAVVLQEPDRIGGSFSSGPRTFLSAEGFARTALDGRGSRVSHKTLLRLPPGSDAESARQAAQVLKEQITSLPGAGAYEVETYAEAQPSLRRGLARAERFLGLVALLSLLLGGVGVGQTVHSWLQTRLDAIAVLKCLGLRPRQILALYLGQTALLGLAGSLAGVVLGTAIQWMVPLFLGDLVPGDAVRRIEWGAIGRGVGLGICVSLLFSVAPLLAVLRVPAARVLRRDAEPLPAHRVTRWVMGGAFLFGVWALAASQARSALLGAQFAAGIGIAVLALALSSSLLVAILRRSTHRFSRVWVRYGLAALHRPGAGARAAILSLGVGVLVVLGMWQIESLLAAQLDRELPRDAPSAFLIDIQPDQWSGVRAILEEEGATRIDTVPVVMARLQAIDGVSSDEIADAADPKERGRRWALTREQRLTYAATLPDDNKIVAGTLWGDPERDEVSVEEEFARDLGVSVGSVLRFDIQGVSFDLHVTSLRTVEWETFGINFFLVVEPGVLEDAPQLRLAAARMPPPATPGAQLPEQIVQDRVAAAFPNVTLIRIRDVLERIAAILGRIGLGIRFLGGFTVLAGIAILAGAISAGAARRGRETALLKTLGMTRSGVVSVFALEYALVGLVAGIVGAVAGTVLAWGVLTRGLEVDWHFPGASIAIAIVGAVVLSVLAGLAASVRAIERRPIEVLRAE